MRFSVEALADLQEAEERLAALARASRREPLGRLNVLVGSNLQRLSFRRRLAEALGPTGNIRFFTPVDLAVAVRERGAAPARSPLPDGADTLLVDGILRELRAEGAVRQLRPSAGGVAEAVASSLTDLREGCVSAADYRAALGVADDPKLHDLAAVYTRFTSQIAAFRDRSSLYEDALDARLPDAAYREALGGGPLLVAGIYDAPAVQLALLQRAARVVDVHVLLVAPALPAFGVARRFAALLAAAGAEPADDEPEARATSAHLDYFSAPSRQAEAEEIARRVLTLAADADIPFQAMAVLHRLDHAADDAIAAALTRAGVPVYRAAGRPLRHTATGRAALVLLDLLLQEPQRHRLLEFVGSPAAAAALPPSVRPKPVLWERHSKQAGMVRGWQRFGDQLAAHIARLQRDEVVPEFARETARELRDVVAALRERATALERCDSWTDYCNTVLAILDDYVVEADPELDDEGRDLTSIVRGQIEALALLDSAGVAVDRERFRGAAARAIRRAVLNDRDPLRQGVFVGNVSAARSLRFRAVFLAECAERIFPPLVRQDPLLLDSEREQLNRRLRRPALPIKRERAQEEAMLFALLQQSAEHILTISYARRTNTTGAPKLPSPFLLRSIPGDVDELAALEDLEASGTVMRLPARLAGAAPSPVDSQAGDWSRTLTALDDSDFRLAILEAAGKGGARHALAGLWEGYRRYDIARQSRNGTRFGEWDGVISPDRLGESVLSRPASPTALEQYAECPYRYYLRYVLHVGAVSEPAHALQMTPLDRGSMVHRILERWVREGRASGVEWSTFLADEGQLRQIAEEEFEQQQLGGLSGLPATWTIVRQEVLTDLEALLREERTRAADGFRPHAAFEPETPFQDLTLTLPNDVALTFRGKIDRVDEGPTGPVAMDYKTGAARKRADEYRSGAALQLPVYLHAVAEALDLAPEDVEAEYWYATRKGKFTRSTLRGADVLTDPQYWEALEILTDGIRSGRFFPHPGRGSQPRPNCAYCDYQSVCATDVDRRFAHKARQDSAVVADFLKLQARR